MTHRSSDHWQIGDADLQGQARDLAVAGTDAHVVLVALRPDGAGPGDPERDGRVLAALWRASTEARSDGLAGRRLSWRSFVLLVQGDSMAVRDAISQAADHRRRGDDAEGLDVSVGWVESSGDFIADVKRLETEAKRDLA